MWILRLFNWRAHSSWRSLQARQAVLLQGVPILPPVDIVISHMVTAPVDIVDWNLWNKILAVIMAGLVFFLHCGTPCNTFTSAGKNDGGPPPLRFALEPMGLQELSEDNQALVLLGNIFLFRTVEACRLVFNLGGNFSIENPLLSLMWQTQAMQQLISETRALALDFDQCAFGAPSVKPTRLLCSTDLLDDVCVRCPGNHLHVQLKVRGPRAGKLIFRTKAAQIYPWALCASIAMNVTVIYEDALAHLSTTFCLTTPVADRKRELGSSKPWPGHRQADTALKAQWAGYQLKRGARCGVGAGPSRSRCHAGHPPVYSGDSFA